MDFLDKNKWLMTLIFIIPGFIAMKTYSVISSGERIDASKSIIDSIAYSSLNYAIFSPFIYYVFTNNLTKDRPLFSAVLWISIILIAPIIEAVGFFHLRKCNIFAKWAPHPTPKSWDYVFSKPYPQFVILQFKNGKRFGGLFGYDSFASSYPSPEQIYIETVYDVDKKNNFVKVHTCSKGMLINASELEYIEFIGEDNVEQQTNQRNSPRWVAAAKEWFSARNKRASTVSPCEYIPEQTSASESSQQAERVTL